MNYNIGVEFSGENGFDAVEQVLREVLKSHGFGILTEIDVKATFKAKLDVDHRPYKILGACNPPRAFKAVRGEQDIGILLPCNAIIYETESGNIKVALTKASSVFTLVNNPEVEPIAHEVDEIMDKVLDQLKQRFSPAN